MKVSELEGVLLDYWVAKAEGLEMKPDNATIYRPKEYRGAGVCLYSGAIVGTDYSPSTDWAVGGPIIEKNDWLLPGISPPHVVHLGEYIAHTSARFQHFGNTPLVAAMRAYVANEYGREVDDPSPAPNA